MWYPDPQVAHSAEVVAGFRAEPSLQRKSLLTFEDRPDSLASHRFDDIEQLRRIDSVAGDGFPIDPDPEKRQPLGFGSAFTSAAPGTSWSTRTTLSAFSYKSSRSSP